MGNRHLSLTVKVNLLIVALVLLSSALFFASSERAFQQAVFDPCTRKLEQAQTGTKTLEPYLKSFRHYIGTEELAAVLAQNAGDRTLLREWMEQQPSMDADTGTDTLLGDYDRFYSLMEALCGHNGTDASIVQVEKGGKTYMVCFNNRNTYFLAQIGMSDTLEFFGVEEAFLSPEDFTEPAIHEDGDFCYMVRCTQLDLGEDARMNLWMMLDMTDEVQGHRQFILRSVLFALGLTVTASVVSILLMRRFVTEPIQRLAEATKDFVPEEDGTYSGEKVIRADIHSRDEIGELHRDIRTMQEGIVENTRKLAQMTAEKERVRTELDMAAGIQSGALPNVFPAFPDRTDFSVYATMTPAKAVGGDFYDFFLVDDTHLGIVMADVSDKGVPAALYMMTSKTLVKIYAKMKLSPPETLRRTNEWLCTNNESAMFCTIWFGVLDLSTGVITAVNAGHEYPVLRNSGGVFQLIKDRHSISVGTFETAKFREYELRMAPGDRLFLYTDGVPEAQKTDSRMFGLDRMVSALNRDPDAPLEQLLGNVRDAVDEFTQGAKQFDDLTMLCLEYRGKPVRSEAEDAEA